MQTIEWCHKIFIIKTSIRVDLNFETELEILDKHNIKPPEHTQPYENRRITVWFKKTSIGNIR